MADARLQRRCPTIGVLYGWQVFGETLMSTSGRWSRA
jgi:hypothetical protein